MPCIVPIAPQARVGHIAGVRYPSGREIFVGQNPDAAEFTESHWFARPFDSESSALDAADRLLRAFEVCNPRALTIFARPADS